MGRKAAGNGGQGHFQDRARQLTSSAFGRAILQDPACAGSARSPRQENALRDVPARCARARRSHIGDWYENIDHVWLREHIVLVVTGLSYLVLCLVRAVAARQRCSFASGRWAL